MAPRSIYILPQGIQPDIMLTNDCKELQSKSDCNSEYNDDSESLFKPNILNDNLEITDDTIQVNDKEVEHDSSSNCSCHQPRARRSLLPELELEAVRLSPAGPWFTLSRTQNKRSKSMRKNVNDPVKQRLFM